MAKPKAVLAYQDKENGILVEGLIFEEGIRTIEYQSSQLRNFEYDHCRECSLYQDGNGEEDEPTTDDFFESLVENLDSIYVSSDHEVDELLGEYCLEKIGGLYNVEDVKELIEYWEDRDEGPISYCMDYLNDYVSEYNYWLNRDKDRKCDGGYIKLQEGECKVHSLEDFKSSNNLYEVGLPSHIWIKLTSIPNPNRYEYLLLGMIPYDGFIMPPLTIGNVWSDSKYFNGDESVGRICWGNVVPSSKILVAYNQFFSSYFNKDDVGTDIDLSNSKEYGKLMLQSIREDIVDDEPIPGDFINNVILEDGRFKKGVGIKRI